MNNITLLGLGNIGKEFIKIAIKADNVIKNILVRKIKKYDILFIKKFIKKNIYITKSYKKLFFIKNIIEVIGSEEIFKTIKKILNKKKTKVFITANKNLVSKYYYKIIKFSKENKMYFGYEASVGGGIPIIKNLLYINIKFNKILTIINGTTNYILTCLFKGVNKNKSFIIAKKKGFAEKNLNFDIKGIDIAYKLNIIVSIIYKYYINIKKISIEKLFFPCKKYILILKKNNYLIKYIGFIFKKKNIICVSVFPLLIRKKSIYNIDFEYNCVLFKSKKFGNLFIKSKGAGRYPTSVSIMSDLNFKFNIKIPNKKLYVSDRILKSKICILIKKKRFFNFLYLNMYKIKYSTERKETILVKLINVLDKKRINILKKLFYNDLIIRIE
ncbi:hypothetical protein ACT2CC_00575 [Candidatus Vidania fulgoroideorum]